MKFNDLWCNKFELIQISQKGKVLVLYTVCASDFSLTHGAENILTDQRTPQNTKDMNVADHAAAK